tara:strand:- start:448 stop:843 length:396 start_codon:yes stop_codon:yes gene_type:complete
MFDRLVMYKENKGFTKVPQKYPEDQSLSYWVSYQRELFHKNNLSQDRVEKLESIDFDWDEGTRQWRNKEWKATYQRLVTYRNNNNGCMKVPQNYPADQPLGNWVKRQRQRFHNNSLSSQQRTLLIPIGVKD